MHFGYSRFTKTLNVEEYTLEIYIFKINFVLKLVTISSIFIIRFKIITFSLFLVGHSNSGQSSAKEVCCITWDRVYDLTLFA